MRSRLPASIVLFLFLSVPASGLLIPPLSDESLVTAAQRLRDRDFRAAHREALKSREGGMRDLVAGYAAYRSGSYNGAADHLERAATGYPLLGDYALFYRADALHRAGQYDEALVATRRVLREYPVCILGRQILLLEADILFARKEWQPALTAYLAFIERYASGADAVTALSRAAACKENLGAVEGAATLYRSIWLSNPASPLATEAGVQLRRLAAAGVRVAPYSREELFHRASTLFDLRQYEPALSALEGVPAGVGDEELTSRIALKKGQLLIKLRRYQDAAEVLNRLGKSGSSSVHTEALYWHSRSLEKNGKEEEAVREFLNLAESFPRSPLADDAIMQAALIRKDQGNRAQFLLLLERMLTTYPRSELRQRALWESGWSRYLSGAYPAAAERFRSLTEAPESREKALYWLGRSYEAAGNGENAKAVFAMIQKEYPAGFYTVKYLGGGESRDRMTSPADFTQAVPVPSGHERIKALIFLGMVDDARTELAAERKKQGKQNSSLSLARLYLELGDYKTPMGFVKQESLTAVTAENLRLWNLSYPIPYREPVTEQAQRNGISQSLVYAVIRAESSFSPSVLSPVGAVGLMQLMPATARQLSGKGSFNPADLTLPGFNISCGTRHLKDLLKQHNNNLVLAVAAYNAGSTPVNKWWKRFGALREDEFIENIPYGETREYVKRVLAGDKLYGRLYNLGPVGAARTGASTPDNPVTSVATAPSVSQE